MSKKLMPHAREKKKADCTTVDTTGLYTSTRNPIHTHEMKTKIFKM